VDPAAGFLMIRQARIRGLDGLTYGKPKTKAGTRRLDPDAETMAALREHRRRQVEERLAYGPGWADNGLAFARRDGTPLDPDGVTGSFERLSRLAGLPRIRLHDLRHGAASLLLAAGVQPTVVQSMLGHSSIAVTMDLHSHVAAGLGADASERLAALLNVTSCDQRRIARGPRIAPGASLCSE
jgi:integrase